MTSSHECIHQELLQKHTLELTELEKEVEFKKEKMDAMQMKIDEIDTKIDKINDNVNKIVLASTKADNNLELRLGTMETELRNVKQELKDKETEDNNRRNRQLVTLGLFFTAVTIGLNILFKFL